MATRHGPVTLGGAVVAPLNAAVAVQMAKVEQAGKMISWDTLLLKANTSR